MTDITTEAATQERDLDSLGPVDYIVVEFPAGASNFTGEMSEELLRLVDAGTIRVIDILILTKDADGSVDAMELSDLDELGELQRLEAELAELSPEDASAFRDGPASFETVLAGVFDAVGLIVFFTAGDTETRAWTLRRGQTALEAAATIHTDIARGFIRCEVIASNDLVEAGSRAEAARRGQQRLEGKDYVVADGDVLNVRFNV